MADITASQHWGSLAVDRPEASRDIRILFAVASVVILAIVFLATSGVLGDPSLAPGWADCSYTPLGDIGGCAAAATRTGI